MFAATEHITIPNKDILSWYFDETNVKPDQQVYIDTADPKRHYTHSSAKKTIRRLIAGLKNWGVQQGDVVCVHSFNDIDYPVLVNAIVGNGSIFAGTNPGYQPYELAHAIRAADIKFFIVEPEILQHALEAVKEAKISQDRILIFDHRPGESIPQGFRSWRTLLDHGESDWIRFDDERLCKETTLARLFSSGTTGLPKAAIFSHHNLITQYGQIHGLQKKPYEERRLMAMPMFHVAVAPVMHFTPLKNGVSTFVMRRFELEPYLRNIERFQISELPMVPPMTIAVIMSDLKDQIDFSSIRTVTCGAAPLEKGPQARMKALLPKDATFTQVWGMTETTCIATNFPWPEHDTTGSVGRPVPDVDLKLVDDDNKDISAYDVRGELCIRGPSVIRGYLDPKATAESWDADGFFHTGDIAYCDGKTKKWYIVDRKKELIKVRGFQVAPPELEAVLLSHPSIVDAAVIGVQFPGGDSEYPRAYVVVRPGKEKTLNEKKVFDYMAKRLAKFKRPEGGVVFVKDIPKNPSGKILKRVLRERAAEEIKKGEKRRSKL